MNSILPALALQGFEPRTLSPGEGEATSNGDGCLFCLPAFDEEAATGLTAEEVRKRWPRFSGHCRHCGFYGASYASRWHYIAGDW